MMLGGLGALGFFLMDLRGGFGLRIFLRKMTLIPERYHPVRPNIA